MPTKSKRWYAVARGRKPGIYSEWYGSQGAEVQVKGFREAIFRGFPTRADAADFMQRHTPLPDDPSSVPSERPKNPPKPDPQHTHTPGNTSHEVMIYTDGGALHNPGPGGYGVVILTGGARQELSGGFRRTTNNRMELTACIEGLAFVKNPSSIKLYTDSRYVVDGITKGWARRWRRNNWMRTPQARALNADLWEKLLNLCDFHQVTFQWIKGHAGHAENERCDRLAVAAARGGPTDVDREYETTETGLNV